MNKTIFVLLFAAVSNAAVLWADNAAPGGDGPSRCCDWPSCYDERVGLCLDTCLGTWAQSPSKLFLMNCYSQYLSPFGELPLQCFPDWQRQKSLVWPAHPPRSALSFTNWTLRTVIPELESVDQSFLKFVL